MPSSQESERWESEAPDDNREPDLRPRKIPRPEHCLSRKDIDPDALRILYRLTKSDYRAYLVGGSVRDLLLGITPKDFDIATDARPNRLKKLFRNCRIIGRRFRLAHLHYPPDKIIEVATFRSSGESDAIVREGDLIRRDNVYGTPGEDARRRDITINALFYDVRDFSVIDYVGGIDDLRDGLIRTIADPVKSFREDPVRLLRVLRHGSRLGFRLEEETREALCAEREEILKANPTRLLEELYRDLCHGKARPFFEALHEFDLLRIMVPDLAPHLDGSDSDDEDGDGESYFERLGRLDDLVRERGVASHPVALAVFLSPFILPVARRLAERSAPHPPWAPFEEVLQPVLRNLKIYRRDEDRLWRALGAWTRVAKAHRRSAVPKALAARHYFPEAAEIYGLLAPRDETLPRFLEGVRELPPPDPPPAPQRRRRRRRRSGAPHTGDPRTGDRAERGRRAPRRDAGAGERRGGDAAASKKKRRRRRRKRTRSSGRSGGGGAG